MIRFRCSGRSPGLAAVTIAMRSCGTPLRGTAEDFIHEGRAAVVVSTSARQRAVTPWPQKRYNVAKRAGQQCSLRAAQEQM